MVMPSMSDRRRQRVLLQTRRVDAHDAGGRRKPHRPVAQPHGAGAGEHALRAHHPVGGAEQPRRQHRETTVGKRVQIADACGAKTLVRRHPQRAGPVIQDRKRLVARQAVGPIESDRRVSANAPHRGGGADPHRAVRAGSNGAHVLRRRGLSRPRIRHELVALHLAQSTRHGADPHDALLVLIDRGNEQRASFRHRG